MLHSIRRTLLLRQIWLALGIGAGLLLGGGLAISGCISAYLPESISAPPSYLVVDGFINSSGVTTISLSRTYGVSTKAAPPVEMAATVYIEDEGSLRYPLVETTTKGTYTSAVLTLVPGKNYRLHLRTAAGKEYTSGFSPAKTTPPIDDVNWQATNSGLTIYVNTHDDASQTHYYRWECEETWEIKPIYSPTVEYKNHKIQALTSPFPTLCWGNAKSTDIKQSNTTRLTRDLVYNYPLRAISTTDPVLSRRYSLLVRQYAQTKEEYAYWELLKKNTENIGTLFDPLPSQLTGNVRCLNDDSQLALGYVGVYSVQQKRIFIERQQLPATWRVQYGYEACVPPDTVFLDRPSPPRPDPAFILEMAFGNPNYLPISPLYMSGFTYAYSARSRDCIDCRTRGTAVKPSYWP